MIRRFQDGTTGLLDSQVQKKGNNLIFLNFNNLGSNDSVMNFIKEKGNPIDAFQYFPSHACRLSHPTIRKCVDTTLNQATTINYIRLQADKMCCKSVFVNEKFKFFEYRLTMTTINNLAETTKEEWVIQGDPFSKKAFEFIFSSKIQEQDNIKTLYYLNPDKVERKPNRINQPTEMRKVLIKFKKEEKVKTDFLFRRSHSTAKIEPEKQVAIKTLPDLSIFRSISTQKVRNVTVEDLITKSLMSF